MGVCVCQDRETPEVVFPSLGFPLKQPDKGTLKKATRSRLAFEPREELQQDLMVWVEEKQLKPKGT